MFPVGTYRYYRGITTDRCIQKKLAVRASAEQGSTASHEDQMKQKKDRKPLRLCSACLLLLLLLLLLCSSPFESLTECGLIDMRVFCVVGVHGNVYW